MGRQPTEGEVRTRSFWAWGWEDRLPDHTARELLATQVGALLGRPLSITPYPTLAEARVTPPRLPVPPELAGFTTDGREARIRHTYGRAWRDLFRGFQGDFSPAPDLVATPGREEEVALTLSWCSAHRVAVVPYGGGTSVVGGVECRDPRYLGTLSLDLRRLDALLDLDATSRVACLEAGATGPRIESHLQPYGLTLRHYPQSFEFSTLGGWIATRAGGHYATLYTHIDDLIQALRVITPAGVVETARVPASGAGPDPNRLFLGSEGVLGVVSRAWLRVRPIPRWRLSANVHFARFEDALEATRGIAQSGLHPANCRLLDAKEALLNGVATGDEAVLLLGFESADHPPDTAIERALALAMRAGGRCDEGVARRDDGDGTRAVASQRWREAFLGAPYLQSALLSVGVMADTFETCVSWSRFAALHGEVLDAVGATLTEVCGAGIVTCRLTHVYPDGPAPYYTFLGPFDPSRALEQWSAVKQTASTVLARHGATITHHHAVGRIHRPWYDTERPALFAAALSAARRALDPAGVMNPGVLIEPVSET